MNALVQTCKQIYEADGLAAVEGYLQRYHPYVTWSYCYDCNMTTPTDDEVCLICGHSKEAV